RPRSRTVVVSVVGE
ncbi:MAG: hypothetical protein ABEJ46_02570, partial [Gemmatimonadota bacterium]